MSQTKAQLIDAVDGSIVDADIAGLTSSKLSGALPAISGASLTNLPASGISETDLWRVTSSFDSSQTNPITSNWERHDTHGPGLIGTGMSESSGTFTFPSTGVWRIDFNVTAYRISATQVRFINQYILATTDDSNYGEAAYATGSLSNDTEPFHTAHCSLIFDVTNVSTHKIRFYVQAEHQLRWYANTNSNFIYAIFTRLGDT